MTGDLAISVRQLGKQYTLGDLSAHTMREAIVAGVQRRGRRERKDESFWALEDVDFTVYQGERLGIIGRNGAGKSTLLKVLAGITEPTTGSVEIRGRVGALLEVGTGFHPDLSGRDNIFLSGAILGMSRREIGSRLDDIVDFSGVERFLETPVKRYSSGMYLRLAFAVAAHLEPDILLVDEVLAVGDADFQRKCLGRMEELGAAGRTVVFISHSMPAVLRLCERVMLLDGGRSLTIGAPSNVIAQYLQGDRESSALREWPDRVRAPGDEVARLRSVGVFVEGEVSQDVEISASVEVRMQYWHLSDDPDLRPVANLHVFNEDNLLLFVTADSSDVAWRQTPRGPSLVTATCTIPGHFLAEGRYFVHVYVSSLNPTSVHVEEMDAVSFIVVDHSGPAGVRGEWVGDFPGAIRPMLPWRVSAQPIDRGPIA